MAAVFGRADGLTEPDAAPFLAAHGFRLLGRLTTVEADVLAMRDYLLGLRDRLIAGGKVPANARLIRFSEAPQDQVARLYAEYIVHNPEAEPALLRHPEFKEKIASSPVLMMDDRVVGILLLGVEGALATVHARVVTPELRGGWVNPLMMGTATEDVWQAGARRVRFEIPPDNRDTEKLARRFQAETVSAWDRYGLRLGRFHRPLAQSPPGPVAAAPLDPGGEQSGKSGVLPYGFAGCSLVFSSGRGGGVS
jgi:hypothetical protein